MTFALDTALEETVRLGASDLHIKVPSAPRVRCDGELVALAGFAPVSPEDAEGLLGRVMRSETARKRFETTGSCDLSYWTEQARFRLTVFRQRGSAAFVFRFVPEAPRPEDLGLPEVVTSWADAQRGLVVVTGPTGSGKSSTTAALVDVINSRRAAHIVTIEDPIEFLHRDQQALVSQREIGRDAPTFGAALRTALRQDPDVIFIGEVRDEESASTALRAADTGHLVICTMHAQGAPETIRRFTNLFPKEHVDLARHLLADTLVGVLSQRLAPGVDGNRRLNAEVLVNTPRIRDMIIADDPLSDLSQAVAEGEYYGMRTFDQCLASQVRAGTIAEGVAVSMATRPHDLKLLLASTAAA